MPSAKAKADYAKRYPDRVRADSRKTLRMIRLQTLALLGDRCIRCGFIDIRALQVDHVNGGGHQLRNKHRSQYGLFKAVTKNPELFQLLCANCNCIKRIENNENRKVAVVISQ